ncbi:LysR family transcriptional regulator [Pseudomonas fluorescens HK44]|uniref:LysR family transcriptional regulator n=1 Tax=Pseudomonas fluorescens HK44 TaxID=1042209 RepID=A0A010SKL8_PSEFL|nr:LysR family transcriptional regulator [Pseudomonas fluorescens]EXF93550.1 LysR family transcriptional regulator [Pseudomonas fluorescens HK44]
MDRLWAMQVFVRVVECGSFSRAAESLDIANATVTSSVRNLETYLGVTLLSRNTRSLRLTDEGEGYFEQCTRLLRQIEETEASVRQKKGEISGQLCIESPAAFARALLCPALPAFTAQHPGLSVALRLTDHAEDLIASGTDIAIRIDSVNDADLVARPLYQAHYVACASPGFLARLETPSHPQELDPQCCLGIFGPGRYAVSNWSFQRGVENHTLTPRGSLHFNSTDALIEAALADQGYIYVLDVFVNGLISRGALVELFPGWGTSSRSFYTVTPKARFVAPRTRAFIDFILATLDAQRRPPADASIVLRQGRRGLV